MKKILIKTISVLLLSAALLPLASCGKDEPINQDVEIVIPDTPEEEQFNLKRDIVGNWFLIEDKAKTVVFYADGHGYIEKSGKRESFTWHVGNQTGDLMNTTITQYFEGNNGKPYYINVDSSKKNTSDRINIIDGMDTASTQLRYLTTFAGTYATFTLVRL